METFKAHMITYLIASNVAFVVSVGPLIFMSTNAPNVWTYNKNRPVNSLLESNQQGKRRGYLDQQYFRVVSFHRVP